MADPTLVEVFGGGAYQDTNILAISKDDLEAKGLTLSNASPAEALLVALILQAANTLTEENRITDLVNRSVSIAYSGQDLINQGGGNVFLRDTYQISLYKATTVQPIDPDNY